MNIFNFILANIFDSTALENSKDYKSLVNIVEFLNDYIIPISIVLAIMATLFSIILAFYMMKTEEPSKQENYKKKIIGLVATVAIVIILVWILGWVLANLPTIMGSIRQQFPTSTSSGTQSGKFLAWF